jgi:hypothetical protein
MTDFKNVDLDIHNSDRVGIRLNNLRIKNLTLERHPREATQHSAPDD